NAAAAPPQWGPEAMIKQMVNLEGAYFFLSSRADATEAQLEKLQPIYRYALQKRGELARMAAAIMQQQGDGADLQEKVEALGPEKDQQVKPLLTSDQARAFEQWRGQSNFFMAGRGG